MKLHKYCPGTCSTASSDQTLQLKINSAHICKLNNYKSEIKPSELLFI